MKIVITGQKRKLRITGLPKAELGQQVIDCADDEYWDGTKCVKKILNAPTASTTVPTINGTKDETGKVAPQQGTRVVSINGVTYNPGDPGYDEAVKTVDEEMAGYRTRNKNNQQPVVTPPPPPTAPTAQPTTTVTQPVTTVPTIEPAVTATTGSTTSTTNTTTNSESNSLDDMIPLVSLDLSRKERRQERRKGYEHDESNVKPKPTSFFDQIGVNTNRFNTTVDAFKGMTDKLGVVGQFIGDRNKQKDYNQWARNQRYNSAAVVPASRSGVHGNYSVTGSSYGTLRAPEVGFTNEGRYMNNPGMKIRAFGGAIEDALEMPIEYVDVDKLMQDKPVQQPIEQTESAPVENQNVSGMSGAFAMPLSTIKITSGFGSREAPKAGASTDHNGVDLFAPVNTPVFSPMDGIVEKVYYNDLGGKQLIIRNADGSRSGFAHLNDYGVAVGDKITKGQKVALSGNTGNSTGPHLHFTFRNVQGDLVDPSTFFNINSDDNASSGGLSNMDHNNPGNIHFGDFTNRYGATKGRKDGDGYIAIFPDAQTGLKAMDDLLFSPDGTYYNKTIADARNTYVGLPTESSRAIVSAMGGNKKLSDLTPEERKKLKQEFTKWEDRNVYNAYRKNGYFETGGSVGGTVTCLNCGHSWSTKSSDPSDVTTCHNCGFNNNTIDNDMKIRITGGPKKMAYGGQSGYGFDLGQRNTYSAMSQNPYEEASRTLGPVDRKDANIEAEKGETVYGDLNNDGHNEHMIIGGKKHTQGGTPLNVPEGSFIFSDTKKMKIKDPEVLKYFGLTPRKDGYTPAEIAKRYDVNKYKAILQDPYADSIKKKTASLMMESYEKKLGYLALIQESMKGFPQGIPKIAEEVMGGGQQDSQQGAIPQEQQAPPQQGPQEEMMEGPQGQEAPEEEQMEQMPPMQMYGGAYDFGGSYIPEYNYAYGGVPQYELAGTVDKGKKKKYKVKTDKEIEAEYRDRKSIPSEYKPYEGIKDLYWKQGQLGKPGTAGKKYVPNENAWWRSLTPEQKKAHNAKVRKMITSDPVYTGTPEIPATPDDYIYTEDPNVVKDPGPKFMCNPSGGGVMAIDPYTPVAPGAVTYNTREEAEKVCTSVPKKGPSYICEDNIIKTLPEGSTTVGYATVEEAQASCGKIPKTKQPGFGMPPTFNAAAAVGPKKKHPWAAKLEQYMPNPAFKSPERELAENAGLATAMTRGFTGSPQQYLAMANAAQQGAIGNAGNIIGKISNDNVGIANQFSPLQTNIMNEMMRYDANRQDTLHHNENMYDKEYRNGLRSYFHNYVDVPNKANYEYITKRNIMNASNPYYNLIDSPMGGNLMLKPGANAYSAVTGRASGSSAGIDAATKNKYIARISELKAGGLDSRQMTPILNAEFPGMYGSSKSSSRANSQQAAANQYMNMFPGSNYQYPSNYQDESDYDG